MNLYSKNNMNNPIAAYIQRRREKEEEIAVNILRHEFSVVEKGGILWLTHNGVAFEQLDAEATASEIADRLNNARISAATFRKL